MKRVTGICSIGLIVLLAAGVNPAAAQWPDDPAVNLAIADNGSGDQSVPKVATEQGGGCYVGWYDNSRTGNYDVYLQRLDETGTEMWPHNGICISNHPQNSWLTDWDLIADSQGNCILAFNDIRDGADWDIFVYKIDSDGNQLWGSDGQAVSAGDALDEVTPSLAEASDGDIVVAWCRMEAPGAIRMQRLAPDGTWRFPTGPISVVVGSGTAVPAFPDVIPSLNGDVIVSYVRDISSYASPRHFLAQRFSPAGAAVWASTVGIMDDTSLPMGYQPTIQPDGFGGLVTAWHRSPGSYFSSLVQHVDAQGVELWAHNGILVSTQGAQHIIDPAYCYDPAESLLYVFWNQRNANQTAWGIYGQKMTSAGARAWTDLGLMVLPVNTTYKSFPRVLQCGSDAILFVAEGSSVAAQLIGRRITPAGSDAWPAPVTVSSYPSSKSRLPVTINGSGMSVIIWEDERSGNADVYGQNLNADGTLGVESTLPAPVITSITAVGGTVYIVWNPVPGALSYQMQSSVNPYAAFATDETGVFADTTWSALPNGETRFYRVSAVADPEVSDPSNVVGYEQFTVEDGPN
ncbi:hypothetical protein JXA88_14080 [Candidatus Fermentibacteria bacterium]|nr:hypothetical protein [Candidatus Fermentibacteria bacterium]